MLHTSFSQFIVPLPPYRLTDITYTHIFHTHFILHCVFLGVIDFKKCEWYLPL